MVKSLKKEKLREMIDKGEDFVLVNVLSEESFWKKHIPGSINIPVHEDGFKEKAKDLLPGKDEKIVVYCASFDCSASPKAAKKLEELGYTNVYDYEGGIKEWESAGYKMKRKNA